MSEDDFTEHTNITTKLKWKLFTKLIEEPSKRSLGFGQTETLIKREVRQGVFHGSEYQ